MIFVKNTTLKTIDVNKQVELPEEIVGYTYI